MERIKLTDAGSSVVIQVAKVETNTNGKWPDYDLHATDGRIVCIPKTAADRQIQRMNVGSAEELVGAWVKVSRSDAPGDNGKLFWNLGIVNAAAANAQPTKRLTYQEAAKPVSTPQVNPPITGAALAQEKARVARAYLDLFGYVKSQPEMQGVSDVAVQAAAATIWIAWNQQGLNKAEPAKAEPPKAQVQTKPPHDFSNFPPEPQDDESLPF